MTLKVKETNVFRGASEEFKELTFQLVGPMTPDKMSTTLSTWSDQPNLLQVNLEQASVDVQNGYLRTAIDTKLVDIIDMIAASGVTHLERNGKSMTIAEYRWVVQERAAAQE